MLPPCAPGRHGVRSLVGVHGHAHDAEERGEREPDAALPVLDDRQRAEPVAVPVLLDGREHADVAGTKGILPGERTAAVAVRDDAVRHARRRIDDGELQQVARLGAAYADRAGDDVGSILRRVARVSGCRERHRLVEHVLPLHAVTAEVRRGVATLVLEDALVAHGVDDHLVARVDREHGRCGARGQPPPAQRPRLGREVRRGAVDARTRLKHSVKPAHSAPRPCEAMTAMCHSWSRVPSRRPVLADGVDTGLHLRGDP